MNVRFQALMAASMKFRVLWDVKPCSHVEVDGRFIGAYASIIRASVDAYLRLHIMHSQMI
jgi:hypothetical protein